MHPIQNDATIDSVVRGGVYYTPNFRQRPSSLLSSRVQWPVRWAQPFTVTARDAAAAIPVPLTAAAMGIGGELLSSIAKKGFLMASSVIEFACACFPTSTQTWSLWQKKVNKILQRRGRASMNQLYCLQTATSYNILNCVCMQMFCSCAVSFCSLPFRFPQLRSRNQTSFLCRGVPILQKWLQTDRHDGRDSD